MKSDVNQDFSKATRQADQYGSTVTMENNVPRHFSYKSSQIDAIQTASSVTNTFMRNLRNENTKLSETD